MFLITMFSFSCNALNALPLKCVSVNNQQCRIRPEIININSNEPSFYPYSIQVNKCSGSCNNINDPYVKLCVVVAKNINVKVLNLISRTNEKRHMEWHETCKCKCRLDASVCNNKKDGIMINGDVNTKRGIDRGIRDKGFIWNPSNCECDKVCDSGSI